MGIIPKPTIKEIDDIIDIHFKAYFGSDYESKTDPQPVMLKTHIMNEINKI